ncbi:MAG TPA: serine hydrolase domain-containing protein [Candidatus Cybelea sp.]
MKRATAQNVSRRDMLRATAGIAAVGLMPKWGATASAEEALFHALDERIEAAMARYHVPGVSVAVFYRGREYVRGYGQTNVEHPITVDGDTLFRIGSVTKTFTGTAIMRLVERGKVELDAPVRSYLPNLQLADDAVARRVTVRQLLNHSAGWLGDDYAGYGSGDDALAKYVAGMQALPQLVPLGAVLAYNNAAVDLAGRVIEVVTDTPYERAVETLVLEPLGLKRSGFFTERLTKYPIAASHDVKNGKAVLDAASWDFPRSLNPTGGLISSARDQLRYARFHLGYPAMQRNPGPGGTLSMEVDGVCVTWWQRRTAEGVPVFQHMGSWGGQNADLLLVPSRGFAMSILTNSTNGPMVIAEIDRSGWALTQFAGLHNPPAVRKALPARALAAYAGRYLAQIVPPADSPQNPEQVTVELRADGGYLRASGDLELSLAFYRQDYVITTNAEGLSKRSDFVRAADGRVAWFRDNGRIFKRVT